MTDLERLTQYIKKCIDEDFGTEHTPVLNWTEWRAILVVLESVQGAKNEKS